MRAEGGRGQECGALGLGQGSGGRSREAVGSQGPPREVLSGCLRVGLVAPRDLAHWASELHSVTFVETLKRNLFDWIVPTCISQK